MRKLLSYLFLFAAVSAGQIRADDTGLGVSVSLGASRIADDDGDESFRGDGVGVAVDFEYRFHPSFALGMGYIGFGRATDTVDGVETDISARAVDMFARPVFSLSDSVELYGRFGFALYGADLEPGSSALGGGWEAGLGLDIGQRDKNYSVRFEGRFLNGRDDESALMLGAGVALLF
ncbi:MAG: outer membrane beta-barrel protein [Pseudomonadota bacterium]